ncbi:MAG: cysteine--tRNA ligase, partial [Nanoarchaeota archaeon]|nr:cysteine--tRNA ligase [Nanoarchaeota archaeon]
GNFVTIDEILGKYHADIVKIFFLQAHYASTIDFSWEKMEEAKRAYERIVILLDKLERLYGDKEVMHSGGQGEKEFLALKTEFMQAMDDDFNTARALAVVFEAVTLCNKLMDSEHEHKDSMLSGALHKIKDLSGIFGITFLNKKAAGMSEKEIELKVQQRIDYKKNKQYAEADVIRDELQSLGVILEDTSDGLTTWRIN